jgi:hypothetical protein
VTDRRRRVMSVATRPRGAKSRGWPYLAVLVLALGSSYAGRAVAQQQSANPPLPSVVYPIRDPDTGPVDRTTPDITPEPALPIVQGPPLRYVLIDRVGNYRDSQRHFQQQPATTAGETAAIPSGAIGVPATGTTGVERPVPPVRRYATRLPNWPAGAIVIRPSSQSERGRER